VVAFWTAAVIPAIFAVLYCSGLYIVAGVFQPWLTSEFLKSTKKRAVINEMGQKTLERILAELSLENFLHSCRWFDEKTGLATKRVRKLTTAAEKAGRWEQRRTCWAKRCML